MQVSKMEHESQDQLVIALEGQFFESNIPGLRSDLHYEDIRHALASHVAILMKENRDFLFAKLYRIDVSEKDVKMALTQNQSHYVLAELILRKLNEKLYWRKKYATKNKKGYCKNGCDSHCRQRS